jgi:hypothetical protein
MKLMNKYKLIKEEINHKKHLIKEIYSKLID